MLRFAPEIWRYAESPYLCGVFFIVLDLRLTKGWSKALLLFLWSNVRSTSAARFRYPIQNHREESVQCIPLRDCVT